jgi:hypothetical protein
MSIIGSNILAGASGQAGGGGAYEIERSVRFNSADSAYLSRTPASSSNLKTWTWAGWVKRSKLGTTQRFFATFDGSNQEYWRFDSNDTLRLFESLGTLQTTQVFRDVSAWYHIVVAVDTTQATASDRIKFYLNGTQVTTFSTATYPSQNADGRFNSAVPHYLGTGTVEYFDGYLADVIFVDGSALTPTSFGEFDTNGVWQPIEYAGTYGTNGFHLPFSNNSTAAALGTDTSGNSNTWTVNNISVTAGAGNDSLVDSPTNGSQVDTGVGGEVVGNYATLNPLNTTGGTLSNGNLDYAMTNTRCVSNFAMTSQKWHCEVTVASDIGATSEYSIGVSGAGFYQPNGVASGTASVMYYAFNGNKYVDGSSSAYGASFGSTDVIGVALDADAGTVTFYKNNSSQGAITLPSSSSGWVLNIQATAGATNATFNTNFGQRQWAYAAPAGFKALCTTNLPEPTIADGSTVMDVALYTGNGSTQTISGLNFSPDLIWIKERNNSRDHVVQDIIRGSGVYLSTNLTNADQSNGGTGASSLGVQFFNSDGFTIGAGTGVNGSSNTYAAWTWDAGSSTVTNTAGSITSSVRANASAGFSVVTVNSTTIGTIGHGLGVKPAMIIEKCRGTTSNWYVRHQSLGDMKSSYLTLNTASAAGIPGDTTAWNNTEPTSTTISINNNYLYANGSVVYYCFAPVAGYSAYGSYTGNGSANGPFVYTGFRPRWILIKRSDATNDWLLTDSSRLGYNIRNELIWVNLSAAEYQIEHLDILSNGFKIRTTNSGWNGSGGTCIYACFAESPFAYSRAR